MMIDLKSCSIGLLGYQASRLLFGVEGCCNFSPSAVTIGFGAVLYEFAEEASADETSITVLISEGSLMRPVTVTLSLGDNTAIGKLRESLVDIHNRYAIKAVPMGLVNKGLQSPSQ